MIIRFRSKTVSLSFFNVDLSLPESLLIEDLHWFYDTEHPTEAEHIKKHANKQRIKKAIKTQGKKNQPNYNNKKKKQLLKKLTKSNINY